MEDAHESDATTDRIQQLLSESGITRNRAQIARMVRSALELGEVRADRLDPDDAPWFIDAILLPAFTNATQPGRAQ